MTKQYKREVVERALRFVNTTNRTDLLNKYKREVMSVGGIDFYVHCIGGWWMAYHDTTEYPFVVPVGDLFGIHPSKSDLEMVLTGWVAEIDKCMSK